MALFICATPIGNLEDITMRVLNTLKMVDLIACEDTRQTVKLLNYFEIKKPLTSYYEHNKLSKGMYLLEKLRNGENIALVSDAGTPAISDPGEELVSLCIANGIEVIGIPGCCALINGLITSGLPTGRFSFEGFLTLNSNKRKKHLEDIVNEQRTMVFYEAPHKLLNTLIDLKKCLGNRKIALAREMTKKFEEVIRLDLDEAIDKYSSNPPKGEFVLIVEGRKEEIFERPTDEEIEKKLEYYMGMGFSMKDAVKETATKLGVSKKEIYSIGLKLKQRIYNPEIDE